jgi:hypothetical protein
MYVLARRRRAVLIFGGAIYRSFVGCGGIVKLPPRVMAALLAIVGLIFLGKSIHFLVSSDPVCNGQTMQPGETCYISDGDTMVYESYDQLASSQRVGAFVGVGLGAVLLAGSAWLLVRRDRRTTAVSKNVTAGVAVLVLSLGLISGALYEFLSDVTCGDRVMQPGDTCDTVDNGRVTKVDYTNRRTHRLANGALLLIIGGVLTVVSIKAIRKPPAPPLPKVLS